MSGDEHMENTDTTFEDMPRWIALGIPVPNWITDWIIGEFGLIDPLALLCPAIVLMAVMLIIILAAIGIGIYFATVNWDRATNWMDKTFQDLMEKVTLLLDHFTQEEEEESNPQIKTIKQHSCQFESDL